MRLRMDREYSAAEWKIKNLGDICENLDSKRVPVTQSSRQAGSIPYYGASGIVDYVTDYIFDEDLLLVSEDGANLLARTYPIAFSITGKAWVNNHAHVLRFAERTTQSFVEYYLNSISLEPYVSGMAQPKLNQKSLNSINIPIPPLPEQKRIVAIVDEAFEGIDRAIANTQKNLTNTRELFESYLNAVFTQNSDKWEWVSLSDITTSITDGNHQPPPKSQSGIPFITISNINKQDRKIDFSNTFKVPPEYFEKLKENWKPRKGDLLYTVTGSYGIPVVVDYDIDFCFQRHIGLIKPNEQTNSKCLYYIFLSRYLLKQADDCATGTAQKTVSLGVLRRFSVPKIPKEEQEIIVAELDILSEKIQRLEAIYQQKLTALNELKQAILQKAFTGELTADTTNQATKAVKETIAA